MGKENSTKFFWCRQEEWRISTYAKIQVLYGEPNLVKKIKRNKLRWEGHDST